MQNEQLERKQKNRALWEILDPEKERVGTYTKSIWIRLAKNSVQECEWNGNQNRRRKIKAGHGVETKRRWSNSSCQMLPTFDAP